jgi:hypothetical protein
MIKNDIVTCYKSIRFEALLLSLWRYYATCGKLRICLYTEVANKKLYIIVMDQACWLHSNNSFNTVLREILTLETKSDERLNCWIACVKPFERSCLDCLSNESLSLLPQKKTPLKCVVRVSSLSSLICLTFFCDRVIQHLRSEQLTLAKCRQNFQSYVRKI